MRPLKRDLLALGLGASLGFLAALFFLGDRHPPAAESEARLAQLAHRLEELQTRRDAAEPGRQPPESMESLRARVEALAAGQSDAAEVIDVESAETSD